MVYKCFDKKSEGANKTIGGAIKSKVMLKQQLANELNKWIIKKILKT